MYGSVVYLCLAWPIKSIVRILATTSFVAQSLPQSRIKVILPEPFYPSSQPSFSFFYLHLQGSLDELPCLFPILAVYALDRTP
jgi:hypothetical protein